MKLLSEPKTAVKLTLVLLDKDKKVIPIFNENFIWDWAVSVLKKDKKNWFERLLFGNMKEVPKRFPFGLYRKKKVISNN